MYWQVQMLRVTLLSLATVALMNSTKTETRYPEIQISCPELTPSMFRECLMYRTYNCYLATHATLDIRVKESVTQWLKLWGLLGFEIGKFSGTSFQDRIEREGPVQLKEITFSGSKIDRYGDLKCNYRFTFEGLSKTNFDLELTYHSYKNFRLEQCRGQGPFTCDLVEQEK